MAIAGGLCIILGCFFYGLSYIKRMKEKMHCLEQWELAFHLLKEELEYQKASLPSACHQVGNLLTEDLGKGFQYIFQTMEKGVGETFASVWTRAFEDFVRNSPLETESKSAILDFGKYTGFLNVKKQLLFLRQLENNMKEQKEQAKRQYQEKKKLVYCFSISLGLIFVIILA